MARGDVTLTVGFVGNNGITAVVEKVNRSIDDMAGKAKKASLSLSDIGGAFTAIRGVIDGATASAQMFWEAQQRGEQAVNQARIFAASFADSIVALDQFRKATQGTVDDTTLQTMASNMAHVGLSTEQTASILRDSFALSTASGKDFGEVVSSVLGALRGEMDSLQEKGVNVDLGTDFAKLDDSEKAARRLDATLSALSATAAKVPMDQLSFGTQRLAASFANAQSNLEAAANEVSNPIWLAFADILDTVGGNMQRVNIPLAVLPEKVAALTEQVNIGAMSFASYRQHLELAAEQAGYSAEESQALTSFLTQVVIASDSVTRALGGSSEALQMFRDDMVDVLTVDAERGFRAFLGDLENDFTRIGVAASSVGSAFDSAFNVIADKLKPKKPKGSKGKDDDGLGAFGRSMVGDFDAIRQRFEALSNLAEVEGLKLTKQIEEQAAAREKADTLAQLRTDIARQTALSQLDEDDRLGRLRIDALYERSRIENEVADLDIRAEMLRLEDLRYTSEERQAIRAQEIEQFLASVDSLQSAASVLQQYDSTGLGAGLIASVGQVAKSWDQLSKGSPAAIAAVGQFAAGFIKNETARAVVSSAVELAAGFASLGYGDVFGAPNHFASSAIYAGVAGMSAASGSGKGGSIGAPGFGGSTGTRASVGSGSFSSQSNSGGSSQPMIINYGVIGMPSYEASYGLNRILNRSEGSGFSGGKL